MINQTPGLQTLRRDGVALAYAEAGSGTPPLVFLHVSRVVVIADQQTYRQVRTIRYKEANLQDVDVRSLIGSGIAWRRTTDSQHSGRFLTLQPKISPPFSQITTEAGMEDDKRQDRNLAKAVAARGSCSQ